MGRGCVEGWSEWVDGWEIEERRERGEEGRKVESMWGFRGGERVMQNR